MSNDEPLNSVSLNSIKIKKEGIKQKPQVKSVKTVKTHFQRTSSSKSLSLMKFKNMMLYFNER